MSYLQQWQNQFHRSALTGIRFYDIHGAAEMLDQFAGKIKSQSRAVRSGGKASRKKFLEVGRLNADPRIFDLDPHASSVMRLPDGDEEFFLRARIGLNRPDRIVEYVYHGFLSQLNVQFNLIFFVRERLLDLYIRPLHAFPRVINRGFNDVLNQPASLFDRIEAQS